MKIALITSWEEYQKNKDDLLILNLLNQKGHIAKHCIWNNSQVNWEEFDKIIIGSPWDYDLNQDAFFDFINKPEVSRKIKNSIDVIKWNINKIYLKEIQSLDIDIIETIFINDWDYNKACHTINNMQCERIIIKASISAGGRTVHLLDATDKSKLKTISNTIPKTGELMIQPFKEEIYNGEYSTIIIDNKLFHTIIKKPRQDEFKVQSDYGGTVELVSEKAFQYNFCKKIIKRLNKNINYGRIDFIMQNGTPKLIELELIEPELFLPFNKNALEAFCEMAIAN